MRDHRTSDPTVHQTFHEHADHARPSYHQTYMPPPIYHPLSAGKQNAIPDKNQLDADANQISTTYVVRAWVTAFQIRRATL